MIALYDHIQELRAELRAYCMIRPERAAVQAELAKAVAEQTELDRAFDRALEALCEEKSEAMCRVLNVRQVGKRPATDRAYVGRPSKWGNPFVIGRDGTREE
jgi:hypothetical protein